MKALWVTDIHLNFPDARGILDFLHSIRNERPHILFLTGDIGEAESVVRYLQVLETALSIPIYFVLGNHDYYRGSICDVKKRVQSLVAASPFLRWADEEGVMSLTSGMSVIGHGAWGDGGHGDFFGSNLTISDFFVIQELHSIGKMEQLEKVRSWGKEAAEHFKTVLPLALESHPRVILLTHVPPFPEAAWYGGHVGDDNMLPFYSCKAVGEVLVDVMKDRPERQLTVLCGHTHERCEVEILPNLRVMTGAASYGSPAIEKRISID